MTQLQRTLGPFMIWGLGVGYVISGAYFGWNLGLPEGGPYGLLLATAAVTVYPDPAHPGVASDSPLPLAIGHIVSRESPFFVFLTGIGLVGLVASFHGILIVASRSIMELGRVRYAPAILGKIVGLAWAAFALFVPREHRTSFE